MSRIVCSRAGAQRTYARAALLALLLVAACGGGDSESPSGRLGELSAVERNVAWLLAIEFPRTDFRIRSVELTELLDGGPGREGGIPSIQEPRFEEQGSIDWLDPNEPVILVEIDGEARGYPIQVLLWHEIVMDTLGGVPIVVTFCPLCNTAITFDRRVDGVERRFGVSGLLRANDLVMFDFTNESLWQQITGQAIVGIDTGAQLRFLRSQIIAYSQLQLSFPDALVLSRDTGFERAYGLNPYPGYDEVGSSLLYGAGFDDPRLDAKERVLTVEIDGDAVAFPFCDLARRLTLSTTVGGQAVVAFWQGDALSSLDAPALADSATAGSAGAFSPDLDGRQLSFEARDGRIVDVETGSVWNVIGEAIEGPLTGERLTPLLSANHLWFAWSIFKPETRVISE